MWAWARCLVTAPCTTLAGCMLLWCSRDGLAPAHNQSGNYDASSHWMLTGCCLKFLNLDIDTVMNIYLSIDTTFWEGATRSTFSSLKVPATNFDYTLAKLVSKQVVSTSILSGAIIFNKVWDKKALLSGFSKDSVFSSLFLFSVSI